MANSRRLRRGVVKQLSNLSIDEVSLVDRGANQHALVSIAKRAPEAEQYFEDVEKWGENKQEHPGARPTNAAHTAATSAIPGYGGIIAGAHNRESKTGWKHGGLKTFGGSVLGSNVGALSGGRLGGAIGGDKGRIAGALVGGAAGSATGAGMVVHHHHYNMVNDPSHKHLEEKAARAPEDTINVDDLFGDVTKGSSFGRGGQQDKVDQFSGDDPAGVLDDENGEDGDIGPGGKVSGVETTEGEDTPPQKSKKKGKGDVNPSKLSGLGKSSDFWRNVVEKTLSGESATDDFNYDDDDVEKHFPGGAGGMQPQNPAASPFPGAQGPGMAPAMQTPGVQPMGMGQPTPPPGPPGGAGGGMPSQLPPDVVQYIQQLEQALDQALGGSDGSSDGGDNSASSSSDSGSSGGSDDDKKNPFGKSLESSDMDETTFLTELAKSLDDDSEREAVEKALETVRKAEYRATQAETIAKAERDLRLEREFVAKAAEFNLPVKSTELGPVLKRAAESLEADDFKTIVKCLRAASASEDYGINPYAEVGKRGGGDNADVLSQVDAAALELVGKGDGVTPESATLQVLQENPRAYDEYMRDHPSRRLFR